MAIVNKGRGWKVLFFALGATCIMWSLGNLTPILMEYFIEGDVSKLTGVSFLMGIYGVASGGIITILGEKVGFLGKEDYAKGRKTMEEISGLAAGTLVETKGQKELKDVIEAKDKKVSIEELKVEKYGDANYDYGVAEEIRKKKLAEYEKKQKELDILKATMEAELKANGVEFPSEPVPPKPEPVPAPVVETSPVEPEPPTPEETLTND